MPIKIVGLSLNIFGADILSGIQICVMLTPLATPLWIPLDIEPTYYLSERSKIKTPTCV